jgi:cell division protein FtsQ
MPRSTTDMARSSTFTAPLPADIRWMNATAAALAVLGVFAVVAALLFWIARQPVFAVRSIRIEGDVTRNSVSTIRANAAPRLAGNFFSIDLAATQRAFEAVPWVRRAVVRRVWPNRLAVRLEEHRPAALWSTETGSDKLVNTFGEVFEANPGDVEDDALPTLQGPEGHSARMLALLHQLQPLFKTLDLQIETLVLTGRGSFRAELDSGAQIELGRGSDQELQDRAQRFVATVPQVIAQHQRPLAHADLRHSDGYAVRLKGVSTTLTPAEQARRK